MTFGFSHAFLPASTSGYDERVDLFDGRHDDTWDSSVFGVVLVQTVEEDVVGSVLVELWLTVEGDRYCVETGQ